MRKLCIYEMASKKIINSSFWTFSFHLTTSLFYLCMLSTFISARNAILTGRMITTWYLVFHVGFIFLRLIQDFINLTPAKNWKLNETFAKFNNLVFISLIFPFALYLPFVYWLLFYYDSNLMFPNFVEISLPPWMSTSSHSAIALVAVIEMTTTKYTYDGNHFNALIIMSTFSAGYIACLVGTYVQYGFWLYPIFHLIPPNSLPFVFSTLMALLLLMYIIGKFIADCLLGIAPMEGDKDDGKFPDEQNAVKSLPISNNNMVTIESNDPFLDSLSKGDQRSTSLLVGLKKVLEKIVLFPFRSNAQKRSIDKKTSREKNSYEVSNTEIRNLNRYLKRGDEVESMSSFTETKQYRICNPVNNNDALQLKEHQVAKLKDDSKDNRAEKTPDVERSSSTSKHIVTSRNDENQINTLNLSEENDGIQILNSRANEDNESSTGFVEYAVINARKEPSNITVNVDGHDHHDVDKRDGLINPSYSSCRKRCLPFIKSVTNKSFNNKNTHSNDAVSNEINHEDKPKGGKNHIGSSFRFRLQLFPSNNSSATLPTNKGHETKENFTEENSAQQKADSQMRKGDQLPTQKVTDPGQEICKPQSGIDFEGGIQTMGHNLDGVQLSSDSDKNSSFGKQKRNQFTKFFEPNKLVSKVRIPKYHRKAISRNSPVSGPVEGMQGQQKTLKNNSNYSDSSSVKQYELQAVSTDHVDVINYCGIKKPKEEPNPRFPRGHKKIKLSTSKTIGSVVEGSCEEERSKTNKQRKCEEGYITRHKRQQIITQLKSKACNMCNLKQENNHKKNHQLERNTKDDVFRHKPENEETKAVEYTTVKCHKVKRKKEEQKREQKLKSNEKIENLCECVCHITEKEPQMQRKMYKRHGTKTRPDDGTNINDHKKLEYKKRDEIGKNDYPKNFSTFSVDKRRNQHIPRTCEELLNGRSEKMKKLAYEKPRYEILPKLKANLKKINVSSYLRTSDKECKCKRKKPIENKTKNLTQDLPTPSNSSNDVGDRTKRKFVAKFFKFSKRTQKDDEKQLVEILKKCAKGSKIETVFATVPVKDKRQLNIDLNTADVLQNFQASLLSDDVKLYKFCIVLS